MSIWQGAERKTRDEERRATKRKMATTGRTKRLDELYHPNCDRSEFYSMADLIKLPALFSPADQNDKVRSFSPFTLASSPRLYRFQYGWIRRFATAELAVMSCYHNFRLWL